MNPFQKPLRAIQLSLVTDTKGNLFMPAFAEAWIEQLRRSPLFDIEEKEGRIDDVLDVKTTQFTIAVLPSAEYRRLRALPRAKQQRMLVLSDSMELLSLCGELQLAGIIPDTSSVSPGGWLTAFAHHAPLYYVHAVPPHVYFSPYAFWKLPVNGDHATALYEYLYAYETLLPGLWLQQPAAAAAAEKPALHENTQRKRGYNEVVKPKGDWKETMRMMNEKRKAQEAGIDITSTENLSEAQQELLREKKQQQQAEGWEKEEKIREQLRSIYRSADFCNRMNVKLALEKNDSVRMAQLLEMEIIKHYLHLQFEQPFWNETTVWRQVQFIRRTGTGKGELLPEDAAGFRELTLEGGRKWAVVSEVDYILIKKLLGRFDPEVMLMAEPESMQDTEQLQFTLLQAREVMRQMSSGNAAARILQNGKPIDHFNASFWGNEKHILLSLNGEQQGWTHALPVTRSEIQQMAGELLLQQDTSTDNTTTI
jgi:hypothetical protein